MDKELIYNNSNNVVKSTQNWYTGLTPSSQNYIELNAIAGYSYRLCNFTCNSCGCVQPMPNGCNECDGYILDNFTIEEYKIICPWIRLEKTIETQYDLNGQHPLDVTTNLFYENPSHANVTRLETQNSKGENVITINKYSSDKSKIFGLSTVAANALDLMAENNIVSPIIESEQYIGQTLVNSKRVNYRIWDLSRSIVLPESIEQKVGNNPFYNVNKYNAYDDHGNLLQQQRENGIITSFVWGYNKNYPLAEVVGADYPLISSMFSQALLDDPQSTEQAVRNELNKIRSGLLAMNKIASVTSNTYKPLIGISSQTDANGRTIYYEYDHFGNLSLIRDHNKDIIKKFNYHYSN